MDQEKGGKRKHLHQVITESVHDKNGKHTGYVHHHVYKDKPTDHHSEPAKPAGVSDTAEEAGEHVQEQFGAQEGGAGAAAGGAAPDAAGGAAPGGDMGAAAASGEAEPGAAA
jgi:hypothetical protein